MRLLKLTKRPQESLIFSSKSHTSICNVNNSDRERRCTDDLFYEGEQKLRVILNLKTLLYAQTWRC